MVKDKENHLKKAMQRNLTEKQERIVALEKQLDSASKEHEARTLKLQHLTFECEALTKEISDAWAANNCLGSTWGSQTMDEERMSYNLERELMSLQIVRRSEEHSFKNAKREANDAIERAKAEIATIQREQESIIMESDKLKTRALNSLTEQKE